MHRLLEPSVISSGIFRVEIATVLFLKKVTESIFRILCVSYFSELISNLDFILNKKQQNIIENLDLGLYQYSSLDILIGWGHVPDFGNCGKLVRVTR